MFNWSSCLSAVNASCDFYEGRGGCRGTGPFGINHWLHLRGGQRTGIYSKEALGFLWGISAHSVAVDPFLSGP